MALIMRRILHFMGRTHYCIAHQPSPRKICSFSFPAATPSQELNSPGSTVPGRHKKTGASRSPCGNHCMPKPQVRAVTQELRGRPSAEMPQLRLTNQHSCLGRFAVRFVVPGGRTKYAKGCARLNRKCSDREVPQRHLGGATKILLGSNWRTCEGYKLLLWRYSPYERVACQTAVSNSSRLVPPDRIL